MRKKSKKVAASGSMVSDKELFELYQAGEKLTSELVGKLSSIKNTYDGVFAKIYALASALVYVLYNAKDKNEILRSMFDAFVDIDLANDRKVFGKFTYPDRCLDDEVEPATSDKAANDEGLDDGCEVWNEIHSKGGDIAADIFAILEDRVHTFDDRLSATLALALAWGTFKTANEYSGIFLKDLFDTGVARFEKTTQEIMEGLDSDKNNK